MPESRTVIAHAWSVFARHDAAEIAPLFTEDAEWIAPPGNATAAALEAPSHMIGREAIAHFLGDDFPRLFVRDVAVTFHNIHATPNQVTVEETMTATLPDGTPYTNDYCLIFELRNGLISRVHEYMDTARGHKQLAGTQPLPA